MLEKLIKKFRLDTEEGRRRLFRLFIYISLFMLILGYGIMLYLLFLR